MKYFNQNEMIYRKYKGRIDLTNMEKKLLNDFDEKFYNSFFEIVIDDLSEFYKKGFINNFIESIFSHKKKYGEKLEWLFELIKEHDLEKYIDKEKVALCLTDVDSNIKDNFEDFCLMNKIIPQMDNHLENVFLLSEDKKILNHILLKISDLEDLKLFKEKIDRAVFIPGLICVRKNTLISGNYSENKGCMIKNRMFYLKSSLEKEQIVKKLDKDSLSIKELLKKRI